MLLEGKQLLNVCSHFLPQPSCPAGFSITVQLKVLPTKSFSLVWKRKTKKTDKPVYLFVFPCVCLVFTVQSGWRVTQLLAVLCKYRIWPQGQTRDTIAPNTQNSTRPKLPQVWRVLITVLHTFFRCCPYTPQLSPSISLTTLKGDGGCLVGVNRLAFMPLSCPYG